MPQMFHKCRDLYLYIMRRNTNHAAVKPNSLNLFSRYCVSSLVFASFRRKPAKQVLIIYITNFYYSFIASTLKLLYSDRRDIRLLNVHGGNTTDTVLAGKLDDAIAIGFHYKKQMLFWTDVSLEAIMRKSLKGNSKQEIVVSTGLVRPEGLSVDWITSKIYWIDSHSKLVEVANMDGSQRSVLFWSNLDQPRAIVVDPLHG